MDEDTFLINAALDVDLPASYAAASGDDDKPPQRKGCLGAVLVVIVLAFAYAWL
jgi:hypothetical protein